MWQREVDQHVYYQLLFDGHIHQHEDHTVLMFLLEVFESPFPGLLVDVQHAHLHTVQGTVVIQVYT